MKFQGQIYKINDILGWDNRKELILSPKFQRRSVWNPKGKSYLIDSVIKGFPLPPFFIRERVIASERRTIREVIDGQQRIRTILEFIADKFTMQEVHNKEYGKKKFSELPENIQEEFLGFSLSVNVVFGLEDSMILSMFSRLNAYSVPLNNQEKLNAEFTGEFKQEVDKLSKIHLEFWRRNKIFSEPLIARMKEVELTAELLIVSLDGIQEKKAAIKEYYKKFDTGFEEFKFLEYRFSKILGIIDEIFNQDLQSFEFKRPPIFYSIFSAIYDLKYGLKSKYSDPEKQFTMDNIEPVFQELFSLNQTLTREESTEKYSAFLSASASSTDKLSNRNIRHLVFKTIFADCFV